MQVKIDENAYVFKNNRLKIPYKITSSFKTRISINHQIDVNFVDLYFGNFQTVCHGLLKLQFSTPGFEVNYELDTSIIVDNQPLRFEFDTLFICRDFLELNLEALYLSKNIIAIWTNDLGVCGNINVKVKETVLLDKTPLISILTPVYKTDLDLLKKTIESVKDQYYDNWELCIVDDASEDEAISNYLSSLTADKRIKYYIRPTNGGISQSLNDAIKMATGMFICNLDHDDLLDKKALLEVARSYNKNQDVDLIYSDEDKIDMEGNSFDIFYKPDWSYYQFLSQNYLSHLTVYKTNLLKKVGGFREGFEGAQDYDLVLRYSEKCKNIMHIPKVLYHWRATPNSTASGQHLKPFSRINAVRAISDHLKRVKVKASVTSEVFSGIYRVDRKIDGAPSINIIVPFKDKLDYLKACLFSIKQSTYKNFTVTLVDNLSENLETMSFLKDIPKEYFPSWAKDGYLKVLNYTKPFNFSAINNYAVENSDPTDILLFLNNDTEVITSNWLEQMTQHAQNKEIGAVGAKLLYPNGRIQHAGVIIGIGGVAGHSHKHVGNQEGGYFGRPHFVQELSAVTGACLMVRREVFKEVSGFEEDLPKAFNDIDLCLKIRKLGYKIIYTPYATLYHYESISRGLDNGIEEDFQTAIRYMIRKWDCPNFKDPYYNPNLSKVDERFSFV